jgi:hypothetical protein
MAASKVLPVPTTVGPLLCVNVSDAILEGLTGFGYRVVVGDPNSALQAQPTGTHVHIVMIDVATGRNELIETINTVRSRLCLSGSEFRILCYSSVPRNPNFVLEIEKRGARYVRATEPAMLAEWIAITYAELVEVARGGPCFRIVHRFSQGSCAPGEAIEVVELWERGKPFQLRLSLSQRFVFDLLARNRSVALDAFQIASGIGGWFYRDHGKNGGLRYTTKVRVPTVKVIAQRIRQAMANGFAEAGLPTDPYNVLRSFYTEGSRRALYRLHAHIHWEHK